MCSHRISCFLTGLLLASCCVAQAGPTLLFATSDDWLPYSGVRDGQAAGLAVDIVRSVYQRDGVTVQFQPMSLRRCMEAARLSRYAGCLTPVPGERDAPYYRYARTPLLQETVRIYGQQGESTPLTMAALAGHEVGVVQGYGDAFDRDQRIIREYANQEVDVLRKLAAGRVHYALAWEGSANHILLQNADLRSEVQVVGTLATLPVYIAFSRPHPDSAALPGRFDLGMRALRQSGQLLQLERQWHDGHAACGC